MGGEKTKNEEKRGKKAASAESTIRKIQNQLLNSGAGSVFDLQNTYLQMFYDHKLTLDINIRYQY